MYEIIFTNKSSSFIKDLPKANKKKLITVMDCLKENSYINNRCPPLYGANKEI